MSEEYIPNITESNNGVADGDSQLELSLDNSINSIVDEDTLSNTEINDILGLEDELDTEILCGEDYENDRETRKKKSFTKKKGRITKQFDNVSIPEDFYPSDNSNRDSNDQPASVWDYNKNSNNEVWENNDISPVRESDHPLADDKQWDEVKLAPKGSVPIYEVGGEAFIPGNLDDILKLNVGNQKTNTSEIDKDAIVPDEYDGFVKTHILATKDASILADSMEMTLIKPTEEAFSTSKPADSNNTENSQQERSIGQNQLSDSNITPANHPDSHKFDTKDILEYFKTIEKASSVEERSQIIKQGIAMLQNHLADIPISPKDSENSESAKQAFTSSHPDIAFICHDMKSFENYVSDMSAYLEGRVLLTKEKLSNINNFVSDKLISAPLTDEEKTLVISTLSKATSDELERQKNELEEFVNCQKRYEEMKAGPNFEFHGETTQALVNQMTNLEFRPSGISKPSSNPIEDYFHIRERSADFIKKTGVKLENLFESSGNTVINYSRDKVLSDQGLTMDGLREITYKASLYGSLLTGNILEKASIKNHAASTSRYFEKLSENANKCSLLMSAEGKSFSFDSFKNRHSLKKALDEVKLSTNSRNSILRDRKNIELELRARNALKSVSGKEDIFGLNNVNHFNRAVNDFLNRNASGKHIRMNTGSFTKAELKKLEIIATGRDKKNLKIAGKHFSPEEASTILAAKRRNDAIKAKRALRNHKAVSKSQTFMRLGSRFFEKSAEHNDTLTVSFNNARKFKRVSSVMVGIVATSGRFILKHTKLINKIELGKSFVRVKVDNVTRKITNKAIGTTVKGIKLTKKTLSKAGNRIKSTKAGQSIQKVVTAFGDTSLGKFGSKISDSTKKTVRIVRSKKPLTKIKKGAKTTGRILSSPKRLLTKILDKINVFRKWVAIILGVFFLIYLLLLAIFFAWFGLLSAFGGDSLTGNNTTVFGEIFNSYIVYHKENKMKSDVNWINNKAEEVKTKAEEIGNGYPFNDEVYEGHHIDKYGSPDKEKGYIINYYNANGLLLPATSSNTKDVMAIACAIAGNYIGTDDLDEIDNSEYFKMDRLIKDVYEMMIFHDETIGLPFTYEESEIYVCNHGCDDFHYYCNGLVSADGMDDYNRFLMYKADGVGFYDSDLEEKITRHQYDDNSRYSETLKMFGEVTWDNYVRVNSVTGKGCRRKVTSFEKPVYRLSETDEIATYDTAQYDIDFAEYIDDWLDGYYYYDGGVLYFMPPQLYRDSITCYDIEYYCNGDHVAKCCYGHKDIELKVTLLDVEYVIREGLYPAGVDGGASYTEMCHKFREDGYWSCEGTCNMARNFKLGDWFDIYEILIDGAEFSTTPTLTHARMQEILNAYGGDIDALRKDIISYGLNYVGKITYEYGGKASCFGPDATFGTDAGDSKGRSHGLDCSGFLNYIIGSASGINVPIGTAYYASYPRKSESSLSVGDLGFIKKPGAEGNHVAMYIGKNSSGQKMWLECNSSQGACITTSTAYKYFLDPLAVSK